MSKPHITVVDWGIILVPKNKQEFLTLTQSWWSYREIFQYPRAADHHDLHKAQHALRQELPVVIAWYVIPVDTQGNTMLQWSNLLSIGKAFGGKGPEAALVQCLADAYANIGARTLQSLRSMIHYDSIDRQSIVRLIHYRPSLFEGVTDHELTHWIKIITGVYAQEEAITQIQTLAHKPHMRPLLTYRLQLHKKSVRTNVMRVLWWIDIDKMTKQQKIDRMYEELLLFTPENYRAAAVREFGEETGYADLDPDKLIHYYTASEIKVTSSGNNYLKHRHYYFYFDDLGTKGTTKFSPSEVDQQLENIGSITLAEVNTRQKQWIADKIATGNIRKITTAVANCIAYEQALTILGV